VAHLRVTALLRDAVLGAADFSVGSGSDPRMRHSQEFKALDKKLALTQRKRGRCR